MVSAGDFRNGITIEMDGQVVQIIEFQHVKPGKGAAFVRTKLRNVINGGVTDKTFRPTEKFPAARIDRVDMQYLYDDGEMYNFMNNETFEQIALSHDQIADSMKFVKENETVKVVSYQGNVFSVEPPLKVTLGTHRAGHQRKHFYRCYQACYRGNRGRGSGAFVCEYWRQDYHLHTDRRIRIQSISLFMRSERRTRLYDVSFR